MITFVQDSMRRKLPALDPQQVKTLYELGLSATQITRKLETSQFQVRKALTTSGITYTKPRITKPTHERKHKTLTELQYATIRDLYHSGKSLHAISKTTHITEYTLKKAFKDMSIEYIRPKFTPLSHKQKIINWVDLRALLETKSVKEISKEVGLSCARIYQLISEHESGFVPLSMRTQFSSFDGTVNIKQASTLIGISPSSLSHDIKQGYLTPHIKGKHSRFLPSELEGYAEIRKQRIKASYMQLAKIRCGAAFRDKEAHSRKVSQGLINKSLSSKGISEQEVIEYRLNHSYTETCARFNIDGMYVSRIFKRNNIEIPRSNRKYKPLPDDFSIVAPLMTYSELRKHYKVSSNTIVRWKRETGVRSRGCEGRKYRVQLRPVPEGFADIAPLRSRNQLVHFYKAGDLTVLRWLSECGVKAISYPSPVYRKGKTRPIPEDFPVMAKTQSVRDLAEHYRASKNTIKRWSNLFDIKHPRINRFRCELAPVPEGFVDIAPTQNKTKLAETYGVGYRIIERWLRESNVEPLRIRPRIKKHE